MKFVVCLEKQNLGDFSNTDVTVGRLYTLVEEDGGNGMLRIIDESGIDYLYPSSWFEPIPINECTALRLHDALAKMLVPCRQTMPHNVLKAIPTNPKEVLFWTGAGISMDTPSSLPSGYNLTMDVVNAFCLPDTWENLISLLQKLQIKDSSDNYKTFPRLEAVLGNVVSILGYDTLHRFSLFDPTPNALHYLFAHHIASHGKHITLNLDLGIENAIQTLYDNLQYDVLTPRDMADNKISPLTSSWIFHLHGRYGETTSNLGLTLENISKGVSNESGQLITKALFDSKMIIFAGYSGSDVFDVNPFFANLANQHDLSGKCAIWIEYSEDYKGCVSYVESEKKLPILDALSKCNVQNYVWTGPTRSFINNLRKHWNLPEPPDSSHLGSSPNFDKNVPNWQKRLVTSKVFTSMGLGKDAVDVIDSQNHLVDAYSRYCKEKPDLLEMTPANRILYILNEAYREQGLYKKASIITTLFAAETDLDMMLIHERRASDSWLAGSLLHARNEFKMALAYGKPHLGKSYNFDTLYIESLRAYMQLCRDFGLCSGSMLIA